MTTPYLSRVLGPQQVGVYSFTYSITNYFVIFATLGMSNYGVRVVAATGNDRHARSLAFWGAYFSQLFVSFLAIILYLFYMIFFPQGGSFICLVWFMWVLSAALDISWLFFGVEDFRFPAERSFITKIASVIIIFIFVKGPTDLWIYCSSISGSFLVNQLMLWPFAKRHIDWVQPCWRDIKKHFIPNIRLFAPVVAISLYTSLDKIMLGAISGMEQAGFYEYSEKMSKMPMAIITALGTVMLPRMTSALSAGEEKKAKRLINESMFFMEASAMAMAFGIAAIAPEFSTLFFGPGYEPCAYIMPIISIVIPIISASNVIGVQYMLPTFSDKPYTLSVCIGAIVNIALNLVLLKSLGALGAAFATVFAELSVLAVQCLVVRHDLPILSYFKNTIPFAIVGLLMFIFVRFAANLIYPSSLIKLIAEILVGIATYSIASLIYLYLSGNISRLVGLFKTNNAMN